MSQRRMIRELRQFAHRVSITAPSVEFLRDHFEGDHLDSFLFSPGMVDLGEAVLDVVLAAVLVQSAGAGHIRRQIVPR
jgi:hypothetical protein